MVAEEPAGVPTLVSTDEAVVVVETVVVVVVVAVVVVGGEGLAENRGKKE